jgi:hypothetical protein
MPKPCNVKEATMSPDAQEGALEAIVRAIEIVPPEAADDFLRAEVQRRARLLHVFANTAPDPAATIAQLDEVDVERVLRLVGTTRTALTMVAAAIVELSVTARGIADTVQWMELRPVGKQSDQPHLGIDITYIIAYRALTHEQRWLLHTLAIWAPPPATISRAHALAVAQQSAALFEMSVTADDLDRLVALALVDFADLSVDEGDVIRSPSTYRRVAFDPYVRSIASSGLATWNLAGLMSEDLVQRGAVELVAGIFANWAVQFAEVIAGPTLPTVDPAAQVAEADAADESTQDEEDDSLGLTPDPALEALTDAEAWVALEPETPHVLLAAEYARQARASEHVFRLCQVLVPLLRRLGTPAARAVLRPLLETGLLCARTTTAPRATLLLATQLADVALDERDFPRAAAFAEESLAAALAVKDLRAIGFATRRVAALAIRAEDAARALTAARQAVALARANGDQTEMNESIALLAAATRLASKE